MIETVESLPRSPPRGQGKGERYEKGCERVGEHVSV